MNKNIIALYIRLSSADCDINYDSKRESNSIVNQRKYLMDFLKQEKEFKNSDIIEFVDDGYTATNNNRPKLKLMLEMSKLKELNVIIVRDFSRFFRDYIEAGHYLEKELPTLGVRFISINDNYDSNNFIGTTGGMEMVIRNIVYSAYSKDLSIKVKSVKKQMMNEGKFTGGLPPYGYIRNPYDKHKLIIDSNVSDNVRRIFNLATQGCKLSKIANILNDENIKSPMFYRNELYSINTREDNDLYIWKYNTIYRILTNEMYIGNMVNGKEFKENLYAKKSVNKDNLIVVANTHKGIVSVEEFQNAQKMIINKKGTTAYKYELYPLKSLLQCAKCKRLLVRKKRKNISNLYICEHCKTLNKLKSFSVSEHNLETIISEIIFNYIQIYEKSNTTIKSTEENIKLIENKINNLEIEKFNLYKKYVNCIITSEIYLSKKKIIDKHIDTYKNEISQNKPPTAIHKNELTYNISHNFIEKILVYDKEKFEIIMKFSNTLF